MQTLENALDLSVYCWYEGAQKGSTLLPMYFPKTATDRLCDATERLPRRHSRPARRII